MKKIKIRATFSGSILEDFGCYSFLNLASIGFLLKKNRDDRLFYFCDGMLMSRLISFIAKEKVRRISFDFTSIAHEVFKYSEDNNKGIVFIGATEDEIILFSKKISKSYPSLNAIYFSGYFNEEELLKIYETISNDSINIVVAGLGAGKQEDFISKCFSLYPLKSYFTCGGFIRQESGAVLNYYPKIIDKFNLRALYRMYNEPHTIPRYFIDYPVNLFRLIINVIAGKISISVSK